MHKTEPITLSPETRQRLVRFAEALEEQAYMTRTVTERVSQFTDEIWTHEVAPQYISDRALDCRADLFNCPEPEIKKLVERIDVIAILDRLQNKATEQEYAESHLDIRRAEKELSELGWKCKMEPPQ
jgi:hypothetical protein